VLNRCADRRLILRETGTQDDHLRAGERRIGDGAGRHGDLWQLGAQLGRAGRIGARIRDADPGALPHGPARDRKSGDPEPEHDDATVLERHR
jgi:hypothetical protein